ncbi:TonB-dependent receptor domain-containing protein [Chitinimonas sp. PSY-7]|uniref:TonB-dependent receptor domain-containing protein n=1 Tax=Chitinimonas sp. PSY-7 TaxID=3459088 RepID=UPI004040375B
MKFDGGRLGGSISLFQSRKPVAGVDSAGVFGVKDHQRNRGLELSVYGEATPRLKVLGGLSLLKSDVASKDAIGAPHSQANLGLEWSLAQLQGLSLDARVIHTSSQFADAANNQKVPSWSRLDLGARYAVPMGNDTLTMRARVNNVTNRNYWASAGGYPGAGYLTVGAPRTFVVSAALDF